MSFSDWKTMDSVITVPALGDNFIYLYRHNETGSFVVDPSESSQVLRILKDSGLSLNTILITHHHYDHTAGAVELKQKTGCKIIGGDRHRIRGIDRVVEDGEVLTFGDARVQVIATPGHTSTGLCYYMPPSGQGKNGVLWTGDTLFVGGCGRLMECDAEVMWESLQRLASLPDDTLVYCGHDYTLENYEFALTVEPDNQVVGQRLNEIRHAQTLGRQTVPSTMQQERTTNPFLRADTPEMRTALKMPQSRAVDVFAELRRRKDVFG
ncbi:MAG: hydroxyacylglutathione hydrolase [Planctomycetota bacterium]